MKFVSQTNISLCLSLCLSLSLSLSMADNYVICLLGAMDRLWFHQIILFSQPISLLFPKTLKTPQPFSESFTSSLSNVSQTSIPEQEISSVPSAVTPPQDIDSDTEVEKKEIELKKRPTRLNPITSKARSYSSSPQTQKRWKNLRHSSSLSRLPKTMSCRSLWELELEEVQGFMDLGFKFNNQHLSPRMMSVVPGLQRIGRQKTQRKPKLIIDKDGEITEYKDENEEAEKGVTRPYLSEAWLIKRPDSPLLNLRIPRVSTAADMKKHLRYWARTVASVIQQES